MGFSPLEGGSHRPWTWQLKGYTGIAAAALIQPKPILAKLNFFQALADARGRAVPESAVLRGEREGTAGP